MKRPRPPLYKIGEEMKAWSAALQDEVASWPDVTIRPMFGLFGVYRGGNIFAVLPRTRTMNLPNSIGFRLPEGSARLRSRARRDPKVHFAQGDNPKWLVFEITRDDDLRGAIEWRARSFEAARYAR